MSDGAVSGNAAGPRQKQSVCCTGSQSYRQDNSRVWQTKPLHIDWCGQLCLSHMWAVRS